MSQPDVILCKPTPWFLFRATVMLVMFSVFAVLFYLDGSSGYRRKNLEFYLNRAFQQANNEFSSMNADGSLTPEEWQRYAAKQTVKFPADRTVLPSSVQLPMSWPDVLQDYHRMKPLQWNVLWREYSKQHGFNATPKEEPYTTAAIRDQWIVATLCTALAATAAIILLRTRRRSISADNDGIITANGKRVPYHEMKSLDLRKWEAKGLAFIHCESPSGKGRVRIDGLTYGGFKPEHGEPAERLMQCIRSHFSGEIIEYAPLAAITTPTPPNPGPS